MFHIIYETRESTQNKYRFVYMYLPKYYTHYSTYFILSLFINVNIEL